LENYFDTQYDYTLFLPLDCSIFKKIIREQYFSPTDLLKYHMVNFPITPIEIMNRIVRVDTELKNHFVLLNSFSVLGYDTTSIKYDTTPNNILKSIKTNNGFVYIIEKMMTPYNLLK
jgi:hypothetical protein